MSKLIDRDNQSKNLGKNVSRSQSISIVNDGAPKLNPSSVNVNNVPGEPIPSNGNGRGNYERNEYLYINYKSKSRIVQ